MHVLLRARKGLHAIFKILRCVCNSALAKLEIIWVVHAEMAVHERNDGLVHLNVSQHTSLT